MLSRKTASSYLASRTTEWIQAFASEVVVECSNDEVLDGPLLVKGDPLQIASLIMRDAQRDEFAVVAPLGSGLRWRRCWWRCLNFHVVRGEIGLRLTGH